MRHRLASEAFPDRCPVAALNREPVLSLAAASATKAEHAACHRWECPAAGTHTWQLAPPVVPAFRPSCPVWDDRARRCLPAANRKPNRHPPPRGLSESVADRSAVL